MLKDLFSAGGQSVATGVIAENLLDDYYRVTVGGTTYTARNQTGAPLPVGAVISVTSTTWGRFIVSAAAQQAADIPTIIIRG